MVCTIFSSTHTSQLSTVFIRSMANLEVEIASIAESQIAYRSELCRNVQWETDMIAHLGKTVN